jgi:phage protein D
MARRTRTFEDMSDQDVFQQVAQGHSLTADVDLTGPTHKVLIQHNQSDLAFLRERARAVDGEVWVEGSTLKARSRAARNGGSVALKHGKELLAFSVTADLSQQRSSVKVGGWDVASKAPLEHEADKSTLGSELGQDTSGAEILTSAFQARVETLVHRVPLSSQEAQAESEAQFKTRARRFVVGWGRAQPNGKLRVGSYANLSGLGGLFDGKYYLAEVRHVFEGSKGSRTEFCAERPGIGQAP